MCTAPVCSCVAPCGCVRQAAYPALMSLPQPFRDIGVNASNAGVNVPGVTDNRTEYVYFVLVVRLCMVMCGYLWGCVAAFGVWGFGSATHVSPLAVY